MNKSTCKNCNGTGFVIGKAKLYIGDTLLFVGDIDKLPSREQIDILIANISKEERYMFDVTLSQIGVLHSNDKCRYCSGFGVY